MRRNAKKSRGPGGGGEKGATQRVPGREALPATPRSRLSAPWSLDWLFAAVLVVAVFLVYQPSWHGGFLWDDEAHLLNNPVLKPGGLGRVWVPGGYLNYWPLTYSAYWLQFQFWGLEPLGFHLVNLSLHAISALLLWQVLVRLRAAGAMFAAAIFALNPVNVESVAWVSQLKGLLALSLALVSVLFYLEAEKGTVRGSLESSEQGLPASRICRNGPEGAAHKWGLSPFPRRWRYGLAIAAFLLSALSKGTAVTLPAVLLACAWWQRGRIERRDLLRVLPYLLIGAIMAGIEVWGQHFVAKGEVVRSDGLWSRAAVAGCAVWFYLAKVIWPLDLCLVYPRWTIDDHDLLSYLPGTAWLLLLALAWRWQRTWGRPVVMLIVCYTALLLPALGFANVYFMRYSLVSDHWQYIATTVPCAVLAGVAATLARKMTDDERSFSSFVIRASSFALLAVLAVLSWRQSRMYADADTLYKSTFTRNPACWLAHNNLGMVLADRGQFGEAAHEYEAALEINHDLAEPHYNLGLALAKCGHTREAVAHYRKAIELKPDYAEAHYNLGLTLAGLGQTDEAIVQYRMALEARPPLSGINRIGAEAHNNLGLALAGRRQFDEAIDHYRKALELNPNHAKAHVNLGIALAGRGQIGEAIAHYRKALEIAPDLAEAHYNLGVDLAGLGQIDEAIAEYRKALQIKPDYAAARRNLDAAVARRRERMTEHE